VLIPLLQTSSIDEIVAQVRATNKPEVELLVPNNMKALQSSAGCTILKHTVAEGGAQVTLFTNDDKTQRAAQSAGLTVIPVEGTVVGPAGPTGPTTHHSKVFWPQGRQRALERSTAAPVSAAGGAGTAASAAAPASSDEDFLAGLQAFEQTLDPAGRTGDEWSTDGGALLFDSEGERGLGRRVAQTRDAWELAFDDMGVAMTEEPAPPRAPQPAAEAIPPRRGTTRQARTAAPTPAPSGRAGRSMFGDALASVFPRRPRGANGSGNGDGGGTPPRTAPKSAAAPSGFNPWIMVALAAVLLIAALVYTSGWLPWGTTAPTVALSPAPVQTEAQTYGDLVIPIADVPPPEGSAQVEAAVLSQPVSTLVQGQAISTTVAPIGRASGSLLLRNTLSQPVLLRAGTIVPAANGVQFVVDADVTIPASVITADGITFGRANATLTANVPGASGNIPAGSITAIPGYEGTLRVEQGAFSGGSDQEVLVVRAEDVNRVLPDALSRIYGTGSQALQLAAAGRSGFTLVTPTVSPTLESLQQLQGVEYAVFPPIGSVTTDGTFDLTMWATFNGVAEPTNRPITAQVATAARNLLVSDGRAAPDAEVQVTQWTIGPQGLVVAAAVQPAGSAPVLPEALADEVRVAIAGRPRAEAVEYLQRLQAEGRIAAFGALPPSWETIPEDVVIVQADQ
jgi:hypothetical protein